MHLDATLAALHFLSIFLLIVFLAAEAVLCKPALISAEIVRRLGLYDSLYSACAMATVATGLARAFFGVKGAAFYGSNFFFWAKMATVLLIALLSIPPTRGFARWRRRLRDDATALPSPAEVMQVRKWLLRQAHVVALLPIFAALMARGIGIA